MSEGGKEKERRKKREDEGLKKKRGKEREEGHKGELMGSNVFLFCFSADLPPSHEGSETSEYSRSILCRTNPLKR